MANIAFETMHGFLSEFAPKEYKGLCERYFDYLDEETEGYSEQEDDKNDILAEIFSMLPREEFMLFVARSTGRKLKETEEERMEREAENFETESTYQN